MEKREQETRSAGAEMRGGRGRGGEKESDRDMDEGCGCTGRNRGRRWQEGGKVGQREDDDVEEKEGESGEAGWRERYQREELAGWR